MYDECTVRSKCLHSGVRIDYRKCLYNVRGLCFFKMFSLTSYDVYPHISSRHSTLISFTTCVILRVGGFPIHDT